MNGETSAPAAGADARRILKTRAQELAREPEREPAAEGFLEVVEFVLSGERYAVETAQVREVHQLRNLTALPCTPAFVAGIVNLRGQILAVVNLKKFFGLPERGITEFDKVIVVRAGEMELGLLADDILGVRAVPVGAIGPAPAALSGLRKEYLKGVTAEPLIVLDVAKLLADPRIRVQEEVEP